MFCNIAEEEISSDASDDGDEVQYLLVLSSDVEQDCPGSSAHSIEENTEAKRVTLSESCQVKRLV